jgi:hypothetical protein
MITERKLRKALAKIARSEAGQAPGNPMSGLSIPADFYFRTRKPAATRNKRRSRRAPV